MSEEKGRVTIPTGFVEVTIDITLTLSTPLFMFTPAFVEVFDIEGNSILRRSVPIKRTIVLPMPPGKFRISGELGGVRSELQEIEVKAGEVIPVRMYFGK